MAINVMKIVWDRSRLGATELLLLLAIADNADDFGKAWPSVAYLAKKIRMSERNTRYLLNKIEATGELAIERGKGPRGCNLFRVQCLQTAIISGLQPVAADPCNGLQGGAAIAIAPEPSITISEPSTYVCRHDGFDAFWSAYPKKVAKPKAMSAWKAARLTEDHLPAILQAIARSKQSDQWRKDGGKFIPHPATWINGRRWEDDAGQSDGSATEEIGGICQVVFA